MTRLGWAVSLLVVIVAGFGISLVPLHSADAVPSFPAPRVDAPIAFESDAAQREFRRAALQSAKVWHPTDPGSVNLGANPPDRTGLLSGDLVTCRFQPRDSTGTTPKFRCVLANGETVKVKYGTRVREIHTEVAATRLLRALGFGADEVHLVPRLRCFGCPRFPFRAIWALDLFRARALIEWMPDDRYSEFAWVSVERRSPEMEVSNGNEEGWRWDELSVVDESVGGATRAELDAFRLMAVFLAHWDNKAANQRLACDDLAADTGSPRCQHAVALIQDLGATFGPNKMDLARWDATPMWSDRPRCMVSMDSLPYNGATFRPVHISEEGRQLLGEQLRRLNREQIAALFRSARFPEPIGDPSDTNAGTTWDTAFLRKVHAITDGPPCPPAAAS